MKRPKVKVCDYCERELPVTGERNGHYTYGNCDCHQFDVWVKRLQELSAHPSGLGIPEADAQKFLGMFMRAMRSR